MDLFALPCLGANLRRASRAVTQAYDDALRETGVRITQFTLLQALRYAGPVTQGQLGEMLALDSTTLTRSLRLLQEQGLVDSAPGEDRRERYLSLTAAGERKFREAGRRWEAVQRRLRARLGDARWRRLREDLTDVASTVRGL